MSEQRIIEVFESPTNEGTRCYQVGRGVNFQCWHPRDGERYEWTVGEIRRGYNQNSGESWVEVYDTDGNLRVELPAQSTGLVFAPPDAKDDS